MMIFRKRLGDMKRSQFGIRVLVALIGAVLGLVLGKYSAPKGAETAWQVLTTITGFLFGLVLEDSKEYFTEFKFLRQTLADITKKIDELSVFYAFRTDEKTLENLLSTSEKIETRARWVVPFFVSRMLSSQIREASKVGFLVGRGSGFSQLLSRLLPFCSRSVSMTCPYTPRQWFEELLEDARRRELAMGNKLSFSDFPGHVKDFLNLSVPTKNRLVLLRDDDLTDLFATSNLDALQCFLRYADGEFNVSTRFACESVLCRGDCIHKAECNVFKDRRDIQLWDESVLVEYSSARQYCEVSLQPSLIYRDLFTTCFNADCNITLQEMRYLVEKLKAGVATAERTGKSVRVPINDWRVEFEYPSNTVNKLP